MDWFSSGYPGQELSQECWHWRMQYRTSHQKIYRSTRCPGPSSLSCAAGHGGPSSSRHLPQYPAAAEACFHLYHPLPVWCKHPWSFRSRSGRRQAESERPLFFPWINMPGKKLVQSCWDWFCWCGLSIWYLKKSELEIDGQLRFSVFWILFKKSFKPRREISKDFQWIFSFCYFSNFL